MRNPPDNNQLRGLTRFAAIISTHTPASLQMRSGDNTLIFQATKVTKFKQPGLTTESGPMRTGFFYPCEANCGIILPTPSSPRLWLVRTRFCKYARCSFYLLFFFCITMNHSPVIRCTDLQRLHNLLQWRGESRSSSSQGPPPDYISIIQSAYPRNSAPYFV